VSSLALQQTATDFDTCTATLARQHTHCNTLQTTAMQNHEDSGVPSLALQQTATDCDTCTATHARQHTHGNTWTATHYNTLQHKIMKVVRLAPCGCVAVCCSVLQCVAVCCSVLQWLDCIQHNHQTATHCTTRTSPHCNRLRRAHCSTPQQTATDCNTILPELRDCLHVASLY